MTGGLFFGNSSSNLLAVYVDATEAQCTGWWYEGGGVFRSASLTSSSPSAHVIPHGLHADVTLGDAFAYPAVPANGVTVGTATALAFVDFETDVNATTSVSADFTLDS